MPHLGCESPQGAHDTPSSEVLPLLLHPLSGISLSATQIGWLGWGVASRENGRLLFDGVPDLTSKFIPHIITFEIAFFFNDFSSTLTKISKENLNLKSFAFVNWWVYYIKNRYFARINKDLYTRFDLKIYRLPKSCYEHIMH